MSRQTASDYAHAAIGRAETLLEQADKLKHDDDDSLSLSLRTAAVAEAGIAQAIALAAILDHMEAR